MALTRKKMAWTLAALLILLASLVLMWQQWQQWRIASRFNTQLAQQAYDLAAAHRGDEAIFVEAFNAQRAKDFDTALTAYRKIENSRHQLLQSRVQYNMATLYLQRAMEARSSNDMDIAMPLLELSKHLYREILRRDPQQWDAKYNLERALQLAPDLPEEEAAEEIMPERAPDATGSIEIDKALP